MVLDNRTILYLSISIIAVISALLPFSSSYSGTRNNRLWEGSNLSLLAGFLLLSTQGFISPWLSIVIANTLILFSFLLISATVTEAIGNPFHWKVFSLFLCLTFSIIFWFSIAAPNPWFRLQIISVVAIILCAYTIVQLKKVGHAFPSRGTASLSIAFYVLGFASLLRMFLMSLDITSVFQYDLAATATFVSTLAAFLAWNFGMFDFHVRQFSNEGHDKMHLLENRNSELDFLYTIHEKLAGSLDISELSDSALLMIQKTIGCEAVGISIYDHATGTIRLESSYGLPPKFAEMVRVMSPGQNASGTAYQTGKAIFIDLSTSSSSELHTLMAQAGYNQHASIPLRAGGRVLGVLNAAKRSPLPFLEREVRMLESSASILGSALNTADHYATAVRELEQRILYENELEIFFNTSLDMLCIMDMEGQFKKISSRWTQVLGWSEEELLRMPVEKRIFSEDIGATREMVGKLRRGGSIFGFINRYYTWDKSIRWFEWNAYGNAEIGVIIGAARDITERKQNEAALLDASRIIEQKNSDLTEMMEQLKHAAITDSLTGLYNRRYIMERIHEETHRFHRDGEPFSFIIGDIDRFKLFNDTHGHDCGDFVLIKVAETLQAECRESDVLCRWGGEEFLILLPGTDLKEACSVAERIRLNLEQSEFEYHDIICRATMTFGVEEFDQYRGVDVSIQRADLMLLKGKANGRNRVECGYTEQ